jgi:CHASE3 domain sensor protein
LIAYASKLQRKAVRRRILGFGALAAIGLMFAAILANSFKASAERRHAEQLHVHTLNVLLVAGRLETAVNAALRGQRGYLITGDPEFLQPYHQELDRSRNLLAALRALTGDNELQRRNLDLLGRRLDVYLATLGRLVTLQDEGRTGEAVAAVRARAGRAQIADFLDALGRVELEERRLLDQRSLASARADAEIDNYNHVLAIAGALLIALVIAAVASAARAHAHALAWPRSCTRSPRPTR